MADKEIDETSDPAEQPEPVQQPAPEEDNDTALMLAILAVLVLGPPVASAVEQILGIVPPKERIDARSLTAALLAAGYKPGKKEVPVKLNDPVTAARLGNLKFRALFILNAARRLSAADNFKNQLQREKQLFRAHKEASQRRVEAAVRADDLSVLYGPVLGWHGTQDSRTTPDCSFLIGKNFEIGKPPGGFYPGARHFRCRCYPGPEWVGADVVSEIPSGLQ